MILVTGASGAVGSALVAQLAGQGHSVRAMTRRPGAVTAPAGVEVVAGDADDPTSLDEAFAGADRAFLMSGQTIAAGRPTHDLHLVAAAQRAGLAHVVKLGVYSGSHGDDVLGRWHAEAEQAVTSSGIDWTLLRPGRFFSNALHWAPILRRSGTVHLPFAHRPTAGIAPADIAAVAALALTTPHLVHAALQLTGPEILTPTQEVAVLSEVLARPLHVVEVPPSAARDGMVAGGMSPEAADAAVARALGGSDVPEVLPTVSQVLARPATTFRQWATAHAHAFTSP